MEWTKKKLGALVAILAAALTGGVVVARSGDDKVASNPAAARQEAEEAARDPQKAAEEAREAGKEAAAGADEAARDPSKAPEKAGEGAEDVGKEVKGGGGGGGGGQEDQGRGDAGGADRGGRDGRGGGAERAGDTAERKASRRSGAPRIYRIRRGDTLWAISERNLGSDPSNTAIANRVLVVARINDIENPDLIYAGDTLRLRR